jgi:hypothetical protein
LEIIVLKEFIKVMYTLLRDFLPVRLFRTQGTVRSQQQIIGNIGKYTEIDDR